MTEPSPATPPGPTPPLLGGRDIGVAYFAISGVRDRLLGEAGITFEESLLLNALAGRGGSAPRRDLVDLLVDGLKIAAATASRRVDELIAQGWATGGDTVQASAAGLAAHERFSSRIAENAPALYGGIPDEDLAVTSRVLRIVAERANRQLELGSRR